jgi:NAD(P)-dependent dehydrogenase (short-subunit alcohol dehydrogenase family)
MGTAVIITGASRGIGAATARLAGAAGYSVCVNYRQNREAAESVVAGIEAAGARAIAVAADVALESDVARLFETTDRALGRLFGLVNNAAILETQVPMKRGGQPDEVARAILWLLSDAASFTTGAFIDVTGGK